MSKRKSTFEFIEQANKIHNNKYDYSNVIYTSNKDKIEIICNTHGSFFQNALSHLQGTGCPKCSGRCKLTIQEFIDKSRNIHGNKYDYSMVNYKNAFTLITIVCPIHGQFKQRPNTHLNGSGCIKCGIVVTSNFKRKTICQFITDANKIHNYLYDYSKSKYIGEHEKLEIICKLHGSFWQSPHVHLRGDSCGCPKCRMSKGEKRISVYLDKNKIIYVQQKSFNDCRNPKTNRLLKFDFYIPSKNLLIEYDGNQHFMYGRKLGNYISTEKDLTEVRFRDNIKTNYAAINNIELLRIPYTKLSEIESVLHDNL